VITIDFPRYVKAKGYPNILNVFLFNPGFRFVFLMRMCQHYSRLHPFGLLARMWYKRASVRFGLQIPHATRIGKGFFLGHWGNIIINAGTIIGANCNIAQGVTLGVVNMGDKKGCPVIGDRVWIGANAVVVGNVKIGNDVLIAPLAYVNFDVPDRCTVIGNPGQIIQQKGSEGYVNYLVST
jgi:serine O-acetyltransferase